MIGSASVACPEVGKNKMRRGLPVRQRAAPQVVRSDTGLAGDVSLRRGDENPTGSTGADSNGGVSASLGHPSRSWSAWPQALGRTRSRNVESSCSVRGRVDVRDQTPGWDRPPARGDYCTITQPYILLSTKCGAEVQMTR